MKLIVCDVEGTIFKPHSIKDAEHASYIWTKIAEELGPKAIADELQTQRIWREGGYGPKGTGAAYIKWVKATIKIHKKYHLTSEKFSRIINDAPYISGAKEFFELLNRAEYIPVLISGGIQNLNKKACQDLKIKCENSFASCEYYFSPNGKIDWDLSLVNSSNFMGKEELVGVLLRKYGLGKNDWIFIGDGINDKSIAEAAPTSIGIDPLNEVKTSFKHCFKDFNELLCNDEMCNSLNLLREGEFENVVFNEMSPIISIDECCSEIEKKATNFIQNQTENIHVKDLRNKALGRVSGITQDQEVISKIRNKLSGMSELLETGQQSIILFSELMKKEYITSSILQPFCNANELMMHISFVLLAHDELLKKFIQCQSKPSKCKGDNSIYSWMNEVDNLSMKYILKDYKDIRNLAAHTYRLISIDAAQSFALRTYEIIQRLELLINPIDF